MARVSPSSWETESVLRCGTKHRACFPRKPVFISSAPCRVCLSERVGLRGGVYLHQDDASAVIMRAQCYISVLYILIEIVRSHAVQRMWLLLHLIPVLPYSLRNEKAASYHWSSPLTKSPYRSIRLARLSSVCSSSLCRFSQAIDSLHRCIPILSQFEVVKVGSSA